MKYIIGRLTQISFWFGILIVLATTFGTRHEVLAIGIVMLFIKDEFIKNLVNAWAPGLSKWLEDL